MLVLQNNFLTEDLILELAVVEFSELKCLLSEINAVTELKHKIFVEYFANTGYFEFIRI